LSAHLTSLLAAVVIGAGAGIVLMAVAVAMMPAGAAP
jgi:hypothetical protein